MVSKRDETSCNFLEGSRLAKIHSLADTEHQLYSLPPLSKLGSGEWRLIYRHYATLYFVFCVDSNESELGILDLIQASQRSESHSDHLYTSSPLIRCLWRHWIVVLRMCVSWTSYSTWIVCTTFCKRSALEEWS